MQTLRNNRSYRARSRTGSPEVPATPLAASPARVARRSDQTKERRGAAGVALIAFLALIAAAALAVLVCAPHDREAVATTPLAGGTAPDSSPAGGDGRGAELRGVAQPDGDPASAELSPPSSGDASPAGSGRSLGSIRGSLELAPGSAPLTAWTLKVGPSRSLVGRESAVERTLEFAGDVRDFRVDDLPFAGYDVSASAPGRNGTIVPVFVRRGSASPYVVLQLRPSGFVVGAVLDHESLGVEGLTVSLEPLPRGTPLRVATDARGVYRFDSVLDGAYQLVFGHPNNPLRESRRLDFKAPSLHLPDTTLEIQGRVHVVVLDERGLPTEGARVRGQGNRGGYVDFLTNERGEGWGHFLPAGRYRLYGIHEELGNGYTAIELAENEEQRLEIRLKP